MATEAGGAAALLKGAAERLARVVAGAVDAVEALAATDPEKAARAAGVVARAGAAVLAFETRLAAALEVDAQDGAERTEADVDDDEPRGEAPESDAERDADAGAVREAAIQRSLLNMEKLFADAEGGGAEGGPGGGHPPLPGRLAVPGGPRPGPA